MLQYHIIANWPRGVSHAWIRLPGLDVVRIRGNVAGLSLLSLPLFWLKEARPTGQTKAWSFTLNSLSVLSLDTCEREERRERRGEERREKEEG